MGLFDNEPKPEEVKEEKPKKAASWRVIRTIFGKSILIEYKRGDEVNRVTLPLKAVTPVEKITDSVLDTGVQYGLKWSKVIDGADKKVENELRKVDVWTLEDFIKKGSSVRMILKTAGLDYGQALQDINKFMNKDGGK